MVECVGLHRAENGIRSPYHRIQRHLHRPATTSSVAGGHHAREQQGVRDPRPAAAPAATGRAGRKRPRLGHDPAEHGVDHRHRAGRHASAARRTTSARPGRAGGRSRARPSRRRPPSPTARGDRRPSTRRDTSRRPSDPAAARSQVATSTKSVGPQPRGAAPRRRRGPPSSVKASTPAPSTPASTRRSGPPSGRRRRTTAASASQAATAPSSGQEVVGQQQRERDRARQARPRAGRSGRPGRPAGLRLAHRGLGMRGRPARRVPAGRRAPARRWRRPTRRAATLR